MMVMFWNDRACFRENCLLQALTFTPLVSTSMATRLVEPRPPPSSRLNHEVRDAYGCPSSRFTVFCLKSAIVSACMGVPQSTHHRPSHPARAFFEFKVGPLKNGISQWPVGWFGYFLRVWLVSFKAPGTACASHFGQEQAICLAADAQSVCYQHPAHAGWRQCLRGWIWGQWAIME